MHKLINYYKHWIKINFKHNYNVNKNQQPSIQKIIIYIKSWNKINLDKDFSCIIIGPEAFNQTKYFKKDYCYIDPLGHNIYNLNLFLIGVRIFIVNFLKNPIFYFKLIKFWPTLFFVCAFIEKKKIKSILSLVDYNPWPVHLKKILGEKINILAVQNSSRGYPMPKMKFLNSFDEYFVWSDLTNDQLQQHNKKTKIHRLGSLKMCFHVEKNNKWNFIQSNPTADNIKKQLYLVSSYSMVHFSFYEKHFSGLDLDQYKAKILNADLSKMNIYETHCIEFVYFCFYLKNFLLNTNKDIDFRIIERNPANSILLDEEVIFYKKFFNNPKLLLEGYDEKFNTILKDTNKDAVYVSQASNLGREVFALNLKALFFSKYMHTKNPSFYQKGNIFYSIDENQEEFNKRLETILEMKPDDYEQNKKLINNYVHTNSPDKNDIKNFLNRTGLSFINSDNSKI